MLSDLVISPESLHCVSWNRSVYGTARRAEDAPYPFADCRLVFQWLHTKPSQQSCTIGSDVDGCSNLLGKPGLFKYLIVPLLVSKRPGSIACRAKHHTKTSCPCLRRARAVVRPPIPAPMINTFNDIIRTRSRVSLTVFHNEMEVVQVLELVVIDGRCDLSSGLIIC